MTAATADLKLDHVTVRRIRDIAQRCSDRLYGDENIPIEELEIISVVIEEFADGYAHPPFFFFSQNRFR